MNKKFRILYGVAGEGNGHSSRASEIALQLAENGHQIKMISYGKGFDNLSGEFDVEKISGLNFSMKDNKVNFASTLYKNLLKTSDSIRSVDKANSIIKDFKPNLVITDFEPISCLTAHLNRLPLISIDNQHSFTHTEFDFPDAYDNHLLLTKTIVNLMVYKAKAYLITCFSKSKPTRKNVYIFPPIIRKKIRNLKTSAKGHILVYMSSIYDKLLPILEQVDYKFIVYGLNRSGQQGNITLKSPSIEGFAQDLADCNGVIANAGFTLISEAIYLRKPYLAIPVKRQFEQVMNGYQLQNLGFGVYWEEINRERIDSFLFNLENYKEKLLKYKTHDNGRLLAKLESLIGKLA